MKARQGGGNTDKSITRTNFPSHTQSCSKWETRWRIVKTFCCYIKWMLQDHFMPAFQPVFRVFSILLWGKFWVLQFICCPPHPYINYIPSSDLSLLLFSYYFFSRNFTVVVDWFFRTSQFSSPFFCWFCSFTHFSSHYCNSKSSGFAPCTWALYCTYNWFCFHYIFLGSLWCLLNIFTFRTWCFQKSCIMQSCIFPGKLAKLLKILLNLAQPVRTKSLFAPSVIWAIAGLPEFKSIIHFISNPSIWFFSEVSHLFWWVGVMFETLQCA